MLVVIVLLAVKLIVMSENWTPIIPVAGLFTLLVPVFLLIDDDVLLVPPAIDRRK